MVRARDCGILGKATVDVIRQFRVDMVIIGISGSEADGPLRDLDYRVVKVAQATIAHASEVWLAADNSKFNRPAMVGLARLFETQRLFTDKPPPQPLPALVPDANIRCEVATP